MTAHEAAMLTTPLDSSIRACSGVSTFMHRRASAAGGCSRLNFEPTACGLYSRDQHGWKLWCGLLYAFGKDQPVLHVAAAIR